MPGVTVHTKKRLWLRSDGTCAFPDCPQELEVPIPGTTKATLVGIECHIVAQEDSPKKVARSVSSLTEAERRDFKHLIDNRHDVDNLVLMCATHSRIIDDPNADYDVATVVKMKENNEAGAQQRSPSQREEDDRMLLYATIIDEWEERVYLDDWPWIIGRVFSDGHPMMRSEDFERLTETREWLFNRVWPRSIPELELAFDNFRHVAQDLQSTLTQYPHEHLADQGWVAVVRFYNDRKWNQIVDDHQRLEEMYDWYSALLEDLALELTRAANLVCDAVRQYVDPNYRLDEGVLTMESGPYADLRTRVHRPRYAPELGWHPYSGLRDFLVDRESRDEYRGTGSPPAELRLPGDSAFS